MSFPLASLLPGGDDDTRAAARSEKGEKSEKGDRSDITGSLSLQPAGSGSTSDGMTSVDWSLATAALREALNRKEDAASVPWQNPSTGARGTVTPIASAFVQDGFACRNFLASHVRSGRETWFEGTACRLHRGNWDVKSTRPLRKS